MSEAGALVIGLGNPLMGDDGLGLAALERLAADWVLPPTIELVDGGTWGLNLLHRIEAAGQVLFLDAVNAGREPGEPVELERDELPRMLGLKLSPHQIDLREVLAVAELRGTVPSTIACLGLQPASVEMRTALSPVLQARLDDLVTAAAARLAAWGHPLHRRPEPVHA
jgi:hydrogenase maturation protease